MIYSKVNSSVQNHQFPLGDGSSASVKTTLGKKKKRGASQQQPWKMFAGRLSLSSCRVVKSNDIRVRLNSLMNLASIIPPCNSAAHTKVPRSSKCAVKKSYSRRSPGVVRACVVFL